MALPRELQQIITESLELVLRDPLYHLDQSHRQRIYAAFGPKKERLAWQRRGWLAVLAAQRVLPFFEEIVQPPEEDNLPAYALEVAEQVLTGQLATGEAEPIEDQIIENTLAYDWTVYSKVEWQAILASQATRFACKSAVWDEPGHLYGGGRPERLVLAEVDYWYGNGPFGRMNYFFEDSALYTALAWACPLDNYYLGEFHAPEVKASKGSVKACDPIKLLQFWEWWLTEAIPEAWELAANIKQPNT